MKTARIICLLVSICSLFLTNTYAEQCECTIDPGWAMLVPTLSNPVTQPFTATPNQYCATPNYVWSADCPYGDIDQNGLFTAPPQEAPFPYEWCGICATDVANTYQGEHPQCYASLIIGLMMDCVLTIFISPPEGGTTNPSPPQVFVQGCHPVTVEAFPNPGYTFSHWEGDIQGSENPITIDVRSMSDITAVFSKITTTSTSSSITTTIPPCSIDADCDDSLFCNGSERCDQQTNSCLSGANPCSEREECDELLDRCYIPSSPCLMNLEPETSEVVSGQKISFTVSKEGDCEPPGYEWSVESTIGSSCDKSGNYKAGINFDKANPKTDVVRVVDTGNTDISAEATVTIFSKCASEQIYDMNAPELYILRKFRDEVLNKTPGGRQLIKLYYQLSPAIVKAMEGDEEFKEEVRGLIDAALMMIKGTVE